MSDIARVAIITGAARGIGRATAERLAHDGYRVAVADIDADEAAVVADGLVSAGAAAKAYSLDVSNGVRVVEVFAEVAHDLGTPTALINNAAVFSKHRFLDLPEETWTRMHDVNLKGTFLCSQAFARLRVATGGGGDIVNVASTAALSGRVGAGEYGASKAGMVMLTKFMTWELAEHNIRVNAIAPGLIKSKEDYGSPEYLAAVMRMIPRGRPGEPHEIAAMIAFILSGAVDFMNGECVVVDGGFTTGRPLPIY